MKQALATESRSGSGRISSTENRPQLRHRQARQAPPRPTCGDWDWQQPILPSEPLLFRYSALTFNSHRIHYDKPYAMQEEGYPGLVVQGPLMATWLLNLAASNLGANRLSRFSFRGMSPAFANRALYLVGEQEGEKISLAVIGSDGKEIMTAQAAI